LCHQFQTVLQLQTLPSQGLSSGNLPHIAWPPRLSFEIWVEASHNSYILQACKTSIIWMTRRSLTSSSSRASLDRDCSGLWVHGWLNTGKHLLGWPCVIRAPQHQSYQEKVY
jgi:hypothetical protein